MTKKVFTFAEAKLQVQKEMDTEEETNVDEAEYFNYFNEAIDTAEALIHSMNEDYFLTKGLLPLTASQSEYDLPSDIYANKIRHFQFKQDSTKIYEIRRIPLEKIMFIDETNTNSDFLYHLENSLVSQTKIVLHPTPAADDPTSVTLWYLRNANRVNVDADIIDIPEFIEYIMAYVKTKIARKEGNPLLVTYQDELDRQANLMRQTLDQMIPDSDETLALDTTFYSDFDYHGEYYGGRR